MCGASDQSVRADHQRGIAAGCGQVEVQAVRPDVVTSPSNGHDLAIGVDRGRAVEQHGDAGRAAAGLERSAGEVEDGGPGARAQSHQVQQAAVKIVGADRGRANWQGKSAPATLVPPDWVKVPVPR